jgi:uncharacterized protein YodC (DUF2158 family)
MQTNAELHINDIVHLNSGSPDLKIVTIEGGTVKVEWRNERDNVKRAMFSRVCVH